MVEKLRGSALLDALYEKLAEEHQELLAADGLKAKHEELADMVEVIIAVASQHGLDEAGLMDIVARKRAARGGFGEGPFYKGDELQVLSCRNLCVIGGAVSWRDVAISVPDPEQLPDWKLPDEILTSAYPSDASPVFLGHYWMEGDPVLQAENALCLDYSAGFDGPLVSYEAQPDRYTLSLDWLRVHR